MHFLGGLQGTYHIVGRVHNAGVNVAELLQAEKLGAVLRVIEQETRGRHDGHSTRLRVADCLSGMDLHGFEAVSGFAHLLSRFCGQSLDAK